MRRRGNRTKFPICTDEKLQVKGNPLVKDLATCTVPHQLKATVVSIGCNSRFIICKKHRQCSFILNNLHPWFLFRSFLKNVYGSAHFIPNCREMSSFAAIPLSNLLPKSSVSFTSLSLLWHCRSLGLPQVVMNSKSIHTDRHGFGWNYIKLFSI